MRVHARAGDHARNLDELPADVRQHGRTYILGDVEGAAQRLRRNLVALGIEQRDNAIWMVDDPEQLTGADEPVGTNRGDRKLMPVAMVLIYDSTPESGKYAVDTTSSAAAKVSPAGKTIRSPPSRSAARS